MVCTFSSFARSQEDVEEYSFTIKDITTQHPLDHATCRVFTKDEKFYQYAISDDKGCFSIEIKNDDILEFSCLGYETKKLLTSVFLSNIINEILLEPTSIELREIIVNAPPIRAHNDTISYNVKSFVKPGDVHLEDVLKKLPGIKVSENGSVSYQGKAISKFYIEGKDLLGTSYNQATRNMPVDAVVTVEVLENHQPIKILNGHQFSDKAALNIKIGDNHKLSPFGELKASIGGCPTKWDNSLFLTQIMGKSQLLVSAKMNNIGSDLSEETQEHIDITDLDAFEPLPSSVLSPLDINEVIPKSRFIHNKSYSSGVNLLIGLSKESNLRCNVLYYNDHSSSTKLSSISYGGEVPISYNEDLSMKSNSCSILPIVRYELNNNKAYVSNEFKYSLTHTKLPTEITSNQALISQGVSSRPVYIQNYFSSAFTIGHQIFQVKSFLRYLHRNEYLNCLGDSANKYDVSENLSLKSFVNKNNISTSVALFGNTLDISADIYYNSSFYIYRKTIRQSNLKAQISPTYLISLGSERSICFGIPFALFDTKIGANNKKCLSFLPSVIFRYQINDKWNTNINALYSVDNATTGFYSPFTLRTNYRTEYVPSDKIFFNKGYRTSLRIAYRNLATMLFSNLSISYSSNKREYIFDYNYTDKLTQVSVESEKNDYSSLLVNGALDKTFIDAGISLKTEINYTLTTYLISQSHIKLINNSNILGLNLNLNFQKLKRMRCMLGTTGTLYWEKNNLYDSEVLKTLILHATVYIFPIKDLTAKLKYQEYINEISYSKYKSYGIFDFEMNYKLNKRWELKASMLNLLNTKSFSITQDNGINTFSSTLPLRGREFLIGAIWRF